MDVPINLSPVLFVEVLIKCHYGWWTFRLNPPDSDNSDALPPPKPPVSIATTAKPAVPPTYTPLLTLPIARRPLSPGFYKAVVVRDPAIVAAIKDTRVRRKW
ncbi:hypothetical protein B0H14DRAFT_3503939 [Mycena olivaceomarginata]|nr:hypothetical protein B0H14DRAFT_3503939 [Mycena olivaceomarginata]